MSSSSRDGLWLGVLGAVAVALFLFIWIPPLQETETTLPASSQVYRAAVCLFVGILLAKLAHTMARLSNAEGRLRSLARARSAGVARGPTVLRMPHRWRELVRSGEADPDAPVPVERRTA